MGISNTNCHFKRLLSAFASIANAITRVYKKVNVESMRPAWPGIRKFEVGDCSCKC